MRDVIGSLDQISSGRNFRRGKEAFEAAQCAACHRFANEGGDSGPDLTTVSSRFTRSDLLSSILEPSTCDLRAIHEHDRARRRTAKTSPVACSKSSDARVVLLINPLTGQKAEDEKERR